VEADKRGPKLSVVIPYTTSGIQSHTCCDASKPWSKWASLGCGTMLRRSKTELGMAHYEVRKYLGWHHHMRTTMLAHFFCST